MAARVAVRSMVFIARAPGGRSVERASVGEVLSLRFLPSAERFVDGEELTVEGVPLLGRNHGVSRAVVVFGDDLLCLRRVEELKVRLRHRRVPFLSTTLSTTVTVARPEY